MLLGNDDPPSEPPSAPPVGSTHAVARPDLNRRKSKRHPSIMARVRSPQFNKTPTELLTPPPKTARVSLEPTLKATPMPAPKPVVDPKKLRQDRLFEAVFGHESFQDQLNQACSRLIRRSLHKYSRAQETSIKSLIRKEIAKTDFGEGTKPRSRASRAVPKRKQAPKSAKKTPKKRKGTPRKKAPTQVRACSTPKPCAVKHEVVDLLSSTPETFSSSDTALYELFHSPKLGGPKVFRWETLSDHESDDNFEI